MIVQILWMILITILSLLAVIPIVKFMDGKELEPLELKAYVFSQIMRTRYSGGKVVVSYSGVRTIEGRNLRDKEFDIVYIVSSGRDIEYGKGFIESAGTVYLKRGSVSFQPVTGKMVVKTK